MTNKLREGKTKESGGYFDPIPKRIVWEGQDGEKLPETEKPKWLVAISHR